MSDDELMLEIQAGFLIEAKEMLDQTEDSFLALEKDPENRAVLETIFRCAHNLKGSGKAVGFESLSHFAHQIENLLVKLKLGEVAINPAIIDLLLKCNDQLKQNIEALTQDSGASLDNSELITLLEQAKDGNLVGESHSEDLAQLTSQNVEIKAHANEQRAHAMAQKAQAANQAPENDETVNKLVDSSVEPVAGLGAGAMGGTGAGAVGSAGASSTKKVTEEAIRIALPKIENLLNYLGEQVILQSTLEYAKHDIVKNQDLVIKTIGQLSKITYDLQHTAIALRMVSVKTIFSKMERVVRDTARELKKPIRFITSGETHELDKTILDAIMDPLVHMLRNAVDHGIEPEAERVANGKSAEGTVWLLAFQRGGSFFIEIRDDGRGLNRDRILEKAKKLGLVKPSAELTDKQIYDLIFLSGFSTHDVATSISGRGVGMDVVKTSITKLKGSTELTSEKGKGTTFLIKLPLTLAIFNGMIVRIGDEKYVVPNSEIEEAIKVKAADVRRLNDNEALITHSEQAIPLVDTLRLLSKGRKKKAVIGEKPDESHTVLITRTGDERYALVVDELITQQRIVHKNLGTEARSLPGVAGGTILGDGSVALILETAALVGIYKKAA